MKQRYSCVSACSPEKATFHLSFKYSFNIISGTHPC